MDMISDFEFEDGEDLYPQALKAAGMIRDLKARAKKHRAPVIFVNDNFGHWEQDFRLFAAKVRDSSKRGREISEMLAPEENDLYILKPQRSGFYETQLSLLLQSLNVSNAIVCGVTTDICVLFTAHDAYMRGFHVYVPEDCSAAVEPEHHQEALKFLRRVADAKTGDSGEIDFSVLDRNNGDHDLARNVPAVKTELGSAGR